MQLTMSAILLIVGIFYTNSNKASIIEKLLSRLLYNTMNYNNIVALPIKLDFFTVSW